MSAAPETDTEFLLNALAWIEERLDIIQDTLDVAALQPRMVTRPRDPCGYCGVERCLVHCVYCLVDCSGEEPGHGPGCPNVTGVWPTEVPDAACCACGELLGDFHALRATEEADVYDTVCLGCKYNEEAP